MARHAALIAFMVWSFNVHVHGGERTMHLAFGDSLHGWAVGPIKHGGTVVSDSTGRIFHNTAIMKTEDGGKSWLLQTVIQTGVDVPEIRTVFALNASTCWVVMSQSGQDKDIILATRDGQRWAASVFPHADLDVRKIEFVTPEKGWLIAHEQFGADRLYKTSDGGRKWEAEALPVEGTIHDLQMSLSTGYIAVTPAEKSGTLSVLRTNDGGDIWIVAAEISASSTSTIEGAYLLHRSDAVGVVMNCFDGDDPDKSFSQLMVSRDGFVSSEVRRIRYAESAKNSDLMIQDFLLSGSRIYGVDRPTEFEGKRETRVIFSDDFGITWRLFTDLKSDGYALAYPSDAEIVAGTDDGDLVILSPQSERPAELDFRNVFRHAPRQDYASASLVFYADDDVFEKDSIFTSRWDSEADSMRAMEFSNLPAMEKYKVDMTKDFSVGVDSVYSTRVTMNRRVRWGSKHTSWDLIKEEAITGAIVIRKYQTIRLAGRVRIPPDRRVVQFNWSSSISGELSQEAAFTTHARQLVAGTHYIFFKALDDLGRWSDPVVIKITVEDFPKIKFPFEGLWSAGGSGSYYNRGHHIRGIAYALDLNYQEGQDGGDSDYGLPVRASTDGVVSFVGYVKGYGRMVKVDYLYGGKKYTTLVSHLSAISVEVGEEVKQGQELGTCGSTGRSSAPHIHWELRVNDICTPPEPIFLNDSTVVQSIKDGGLYRSDNRYDAPHIVVVDDYEVPHTVFNPKGYLHSYRYSYITNSVKTVEMTWRPKLPRSGPYKVQVMMPKKFATVIATYRLHTSSGTQEFKVNQNKFTEEWFTLGVFDLKADDDVRLTLDNVTSYRKGSIAFDAVRFVGLWGNSPVGLYDNRKETP